MNFYAPFTCSLFFMVFITEELTFRYFEIPYIAVRTKTSESKRFCCRINMIKL